MTAARTGAPAERPIDDWLGEHTEGLVAIRRNLHAHPELSGLEHATTELIAERLQLAGLAPRRLRSGTGLVCDLGDGARLALRADIDALGMHDEKDVPYRSQVPGVSHACGHDAHTAIVLGVALYYAHHLDELPGALRFIFQPAEERVPGGALDVIDDGGLDGIDAVVGLHCDPKLDVGQIGLRSGAISSAADMALIRLGGPGGHTARPEQTIDMIALAAEVVRELPVALGAAVGDPEHVKVVFGSIHAGDAANVVPAHCEMKASVRTPLDEIWETLPVLFEKALTQVLAESGAEFELDYTHGVPPVVNESGMTELVRRAAGPELGRDAITAAVQSWGGDDFSWYTRAVPGSYVRLGVHDPSSDEPRLDLHAGRFDLDEGAIPVGVRLLVAIARQYFEERGG
jgi:amidohydrolase